MALLAVMAADLPGQTPPLSRLPPTDGIGPLPSLLVDGAGTSQVFPEGEFPVAPYRAEEGFPAAPRLNERIDADPLLQAHDADYPPNGYSPGLLQDPPWMLQYGRYSPPLPAYVYGLDYYNTWGIGARALADYAPAGYEAREIEDVAGAPEFTPITPPAPVTPEERQKFVTRGLFPGSFLVPGSNTSMRLRGFVRLGGMFDFDPIGSRDDFVTNTIPIPQQVGQNFNFSARYSRFALETWTPTPFLEWNAHTFIEGDFFNGPAQAVGGGGNPFRLRFAFVDFGYFRVGQQNTVFMDSNSWPSTADFAGPRGLLNQRRPGARVTIPLADQLYWAAGIEQPFSDITTSGLGVGVQDVPDGATHLRYESDFGHVQLSSVVRAIGYRPTLGEVTRRTGWGASASTVFHPWAILTGSNPVRQVDPSGLERCRILAQYNYGQGIARYVQDSAGLGLDGLVDPATGAFDLLSATGWNTSYEHWFTERWLSNLTYSEVRMGSPPGQPGNTYAGAKYLAASLWWLPIRRMSLAVEYVWGERENLDGQSGLADRIQTLAQYNF